MRIEETGLDPFEARNYDSRLARWLNPDPAGQFFCPYLAMGNNHRYRTIKSRGNEVNWLKPCWAKVTTRSKLNSDPPRSAKFSCAQLTPLGCNFVVANRTK